MIMMIMMKTMIYNILNENEWITEIWYYNSGLIS